LAIWDVPRMWDGGRCIVIGGGPSMPSQFDIPIEVVSKVRDKADLLGPQAYSPYMESIYEEHVIVVNNGYQLGDWPDICLFGDQPWYLVHRQTLAKWPGIKVHCCKSDCIDQRDGVKYLARDREKRFGLCTNPRRVAWGWNTGSSSINLAVHFGVRQIILLGFDMSWGIASQSHWHRGHGNEHRPRPNYSKWIKGLSVLAKDAAGLGIEIINCSPGSAITAFPVAELKDVLK